MDIVKLSALHSASVSLMDYELDGLLEALRRDFRAQMEKSQSSSRWSEWHRYNANLNVRLLDLLNPKRRYRQTPPPPYVERRWIWKKHAESRE